MNFVRAAVMDGGSELKADGTTLPAPAAARDALAARKGKTVRVGIRPENVVEAGRRTRGATAPLELTVDLVETLGDEVVIHGSLGSDQIAFKMDPTRPSSAARFPRWWKSTASTSSTRTPGSESQADAAQSGTRTGRRRKAALFL